MKTFKRGLGCSVVALLFCFVTPCHAIDITLAWDANTEPNLAGYKVYYDTDGSGAPYNGTGAAEGDSPIDVGNVTEFTLSDLSDGKVHYFTVTAYNDERLESGYSNEVSTQCSLTLNTAGSGNVGLDPAGGSYDVGTEVELEALAEPGWQFSGWSGDLTGSSNPATITMCSHKTVTATFTQTPLVINTFTATPNTINEGEFVTLEWNITGAESATIDNGVGAVSHSNGSVQDAPTITTTYTLTATNSAGSVTSSVTAIVVQGVPVVNSFTATPGTINRGEYVTLSWNISGAATATINNGVGAVSPSTGSVQVSPVSTTAYTLTATNDGGSITNTVTVTVVQPSPVINSLTAAPEQINEGESATLSWSISDADSATIDNAIGSVDPLSGSLEVSPLSTTTYTLTATNGGGSVISKVTVTVSEPSVPEIVQTLPHDGAGINDNTRVSNITSFCVRIEDPDGIDITDPTSMRFTIDDGVNAEYTRDLNDLSVVRVVKLTEEDDTQVTKLWVAYDRSEEDEFEGYDFDTLINIKVDIKDRTGQEMEQEIFSLKIETKAEHENAEATSPSTDPVDPSDPDLADPEYFYDAGIEVISGGLKGAKIIYNSSEPVIPNFGPIEEIPGLGADNEGTPMNLQPPTVFNTPVKVFIPYPGYSDVSDLSIFLYTGNRWVLACDADGNVEPGGEGWMVPGSRVNHNNGNPSTIEIKIYHFTGVTAGSGTTGTADTDFSNDSCFIKTASH
ncbi:MAG: hypothetical protein ABIN18_16855 [Pseudomonadota bacterium]